MLSRGDVITGVKLAAVSVRNLCASFVCVRVAAATATTAKVQQGGDAVATSDGPASLSVRHLQQRRCSSPLRRDVRITVVVHRRQRFRGQVGCLAGHISPGLHVREYHSFTARAVSVSNSSYYRLFASILSAGYVVIRDVHCPLTATHGDRPRTRYCNCLSWVFNAGRVTLGTSPNHG